jgi:hypothetical protein
MGLFSRSPRTINAGPLGDRLPPDSIAVSPSNLNDTLRILGQSDARISQYNVHTLQTPTGNVVVLSSATQGHSIQREAVAALRRSNVNYYVASGPILRETLLNSIADRPEYLSQKPMPLTPGNSPDRAARNAQLKDLIERSGQHPGTSGSFMSKLSGKIDPNISRPGIGIAAALGAGILSAGLYRMTHSPSSAENTGTSPGAGFVGAATEEAPKVVSRPPPAPGR